MAAGEPELNIVNRTMLDAGLTKIANAIRAKGGTSAQLAFPDGMADAIAAIEAGGGGETYEIVSGMITSTINSGDDFTLYHNLGVAPFIFAMSIPENFSFSSGKIASIMYVDGTIDNRFAPMSYNIAKKICAITLRNTRSDTYVSGSITADSDKVSVPTYINGNTTASVTGTYIWFAVAKKG